MQADGDINKTIAVRVRALRLSKKMDVEALAKATSLTSHFISRIENSSSTLSAAQLVRIAQALGVLVSVVVGDVPANQKEPING
jgi:transcriptional regulator with XRE-family HTH domain